MALLKKDNYSSNLFTWGYNGYNVLGRKTDSKKPMIIDYNLTCKTPKIVK